MLTPIRVVACVIFALFSTWGATALACTCERSIDPVKGSKMVFWGKVTEIKPRGAQDRVNFQIDKLFKGDEEKESVLVYTNRFNHDCGFRFEADKTYMVYAYDFYPRGVATSTCWGTYAAEEAVADDKWQDVKVVAPRDTKFEEDLRKVAKKFVPTCGAKNRVFDAGFYMVLSPAGDPARLMVPGEKPSDKLDNFRACVSEGFLQDDNLPRPAAPTQIHGWFQRDVKPLPVLLDELECGEGCQDWVTRVNTGLMDLDGPDTTDQISANIKSEREECINGGIQAVGGESHGIESAIRRRDRMLADCVLFRGEFDQVEPYLERVPDGTLSAAVQWAQSIAKGRAEGQSVFPLRSGEPTFAAAAIEGKPSAGKFRVLRAGFFADPFWAMTPVYLEAFAESVLADGAAPQPMRDLAALAYERAALLKPDAADAYRALAEKASSSAEAKEMRAKLAAAYAAANAPAVEEAAPAEEIVEEVVPEVMEAPEAQQDPMLLVVAGVLIVVAVAGIGAVLKKRR